MLLLKICIVVKITAMMVSKEFMRVFFNHMHLACHYLGQAYQTGKISGQELRKTTKGNETKKHYQQYICEKSLS